MTGQALEPIPSQVLSVYQKILTPLETLFTQLLSLHAGTGRYIPGSGPNPTAPGGVADPFTGGFLTVPPHTSSPECKR